MSLATWRTERTGWRCEAISTRHGTWGFNCPCVDLDFVVAEYNYGLPVALIEYKERHARPPVLSHPTYLALNALASGYSAGALPFFIATYCAVDWWFVVTPINDPAKKHYAHCAGKPISEQRFVRSLYMLRMKTLTEKDEAAIKQLNTVEPVSPPVPIVDNAASR